MSNIAQYPPNAIKANKFFGPSIRLLVDGASFENHRLDIIFPTTDDIRMAAAKLVRAAMATREDALRFMLTVIDEYQSASNKPPVPKTELVNADELHG